MPDVKRTGGKQYYQTTEEIFGVPQQTDIKKDSIGPTIENAEKLNKDDGGIFSTISNIAESVGETVYDVTKESLGGLYDVGKTGLSSLSTIGEGALDAGSDLIKGDVGGAISSLAGGALAGAGELAGGGVDLAKNIGGSAGKVLGTVSDEIIPETIKEAKDLLDSTGADKIITTMTEVLKTPKFETPNESIKIPEIIGLPPLPGFFPTRATGSDDINLEAEMIRDTFPILEIEPCHTKIVAGLDTYRLINAWDSTKDLSQNDINAIEAATGDKKVDIKDSSILTGSFISSMKKYYRVDIPSNSDKSLKICYLAESPITESFTNDFGDNVLSSIGQSVSNSFVRQMAQMAGVTNISDITNMASSALGAIGLKGSSEKAKALGEKGANIGGLAGTAIQTAVASALGHGIDFPQIWKTSNYSPSYSFTIRLYNPIPNDPYSIMRYIYGPLAVLMSFVVPRSYNGKMFFAPWFCKFRVKGLIPKYAGYVKNVSVIKGGDNNQIGWNQKPGIVDVKMDFGILYKTMVGGQKYPNESSSPQLGVWLDEFLEDRYKKGKTWRKNEGVIPKWYAAGSRLRSISTVDNQVSKNKNLKNILGGVVGVQRGNQTSVTDGLRETVGRTDNILNQLLGRDGLASAAVGVTGSAVNLAITGLKDAGQYTYDTISDLFSSEPPGPDEGYTSKNPDPTKGIPVLPLGFEGDNQPQAFA